MAASRTPAGVADDGGQGGALGLQPGQGFSGVWNANGVGTGEGGTAGRWSCSVGCTASTAVAAVLA